MASSSSDRVDHSPVLQSLMAEANIASYRALSQTSGVPRSAIDSLRQGQVGRLRVDVLQRLSQALGLSLEDLVNRFSSLNVSQLRGGSENEAMDQIQILRQECDRLQTQLVTQADTVRQQVQQEAIAQLEPWLVQWPTAAHAAQQKADLPAQKLLPLVRPVETLVQSWGVTPIETVGAEVSYDPQIHQPKAGVLSPGQPARVSHVGYRQGDRLLYRAKVTPIQA
ncbi:MULTISPECIES: helix-turn-helix domain-containing protein [Cyanophyceae]|uniref:Helix-turn-helix domain-containing protein n=1 Tax=Leptolyngbya subtilissima DQ-A4 TaxID=2933933 RepID=A0ABV0K5S9_9CYAN|nr:helix-turn-helix domain-containing protein [Nodosilinea sp. FACHB-141]MBD2113287.1 helix-turn-helix domain-containing protein [Nodosilinea sp. FACHB-141]